MTLEEYQKITKKQHLKFHNKKIKIDGMTFDSQNEYNRWMELKILERAGNISDLHRQVVYLLIPKQPDERQVVYKSDFTYTEKGKTIVEDVKGVKTKDYIIKRKLMKQKYPEIIFREIFN